jgi:hypothetical protein
LLKIHFVFHVYTRPANGWNIPVTSVELKDDPNLFIYSPVAKEEPDKVIEVSSIGNERKPSLAAPRKTLGMNYLCNL